jgi:hypothetical protein
MSKGFMHACMREIDRYACCKAGEHRDRDREGRRQ